jgi:4-amino-4-deoxy-L-arabinose transferase-like glycosyltransferase
MVMVKKKMALNQKKAARFLFMLLFFSALFSLRLIHLGADAPKKLDPISPGYICDPGNYAFNARNKIVLGVWKIDDWSLNYMYVTPLPNLISYSAFLLFGVGIAQMNVVPVLFSCLILVFVYLILKKSLNHNFALLGVLLLGVHYHFSMFSRVADRIMPMLFFVCLVIYLLIITQAKKYFFFFLAGISCCLAFTAKGTFLLILPSIVLGLLAYVFFQNGKKLKITLTSLGFFALGITICLALWLWLFYWPNQKLFQDIGRDNLGRMAPSHFYWIVHNFWTRPLYHLSNVPVITCLAALFLLFLGYAAIRAPRNISLLTWIAGFWIISNYSYLSIVYYRPLRHNIPLILPAVFLATVALFEFWKAKYIQKPEKIPFPFYIFFFFWACLFLSDLMILNSVPKSWKSMQACSLRLLIFSLTATFLLAVVIKFLPRRFRVPLPRVAKTGVIAGLVAVFVFFNLKAFLAWAGSPRYDIKNISRDLGRAYDKMSIGGLAAPLIVMENNHIGHGFDYYIDRRKDFLQKYHVTHLIIIPYFNEIRKYRKYYPEAMEKAKLVARYPIWKTNFELWELNPASPDRKKDEDFFEGEIFFGRGGIPRYDPAASGKFAFVAEKNQDSVMELQQFAYAPGVYDVTFFLKVENIFAGQNSLAKIEVIDSHTKSILAARRMSGRDFSRPQRYQVFHLRLILKRPSDIGFRVHNNGKTVLFFDKVSVQRGAKRDS